MTWTRVPELAALPSACSCSPILGGDRTRCAVRVGEMQQMAGREGDTVLKVNGVDRPALAVAAACRWNGWRIVNASASRYYRLALDDHDLVVIAGDGGRLSAPRPESEVLLAPGERLEVLIATGKPGDFVLRSLPYDRGSMGMGGMGSTANGEIELVRLTVTGDAPAPAVPSGLTRSTPEPVPVARRRLELSMGGGMMGGRGMSFTIDGRTFDHTRTDIEVVSGTVEEWELVNLTGMDHPFHLHVWPMRITEHPAGDLWANAWKDTVNVPAFSTVRAVVALGGITGRTVYHCHILDHEDLGMMGIIDVRPT
ncbi:MAG: multicopper oxidase domain-containing protein [Ilumatobacteraceae bacterium]